MSRSVEQEDVDSIYELIRSIGISGVLIAASSACEDIAHEYQARNDSEGSVWFDNAEICTQASEQVNDTNL